MPGPVSATLMCNTEDTLSLEGFARISITICPASVNLMAFDRKFASTWPMRVGSPSMRGGTLRSTCTIRSSPLASASTADGTMMSCTKLCGSKVIRSSSTDPASILDRSRMSLMSTSKRSPDATSVCVCDLCWRFSGEASNACAMPSTPFSGVRTSWLMLARNSDLARVAASAAFVALSSSMVRSATRRSSVSWASCRSSARRRIDRSGSTRTSA